MILAVAFAVRLRWSPDLGVHAATVERLREDLTRPGNPLVDAGGPSPYYSPYPLLLAALARVTGLSAVAMLALAGPVVVVLLLWGLRVFVRTLTDRPLAPVLALVFVLVLWGLQPRVWSGFLSLWALPFVTAYPSTLALALTLLLWAGLSRTLDGPVRWLRYPGLGALGAVVALVHPFTAVMAGLGALGLVAVRARRLPRAAWLGLAAATGVAVAGVVAWPYYSFTGLLSASHQLDTIHRPLYDRPWLFFGLLAVTLPALWWRWRRNRLDPLVLLFACSAVLVALGWLTGRYALGRVWPSVALAGQLALAVELAGPLAGTVARRWIPVTALACVAGTVVQGSNLLYLAPPPLVTPRVHRLTHMFVDWPDYAWIAPYTHPRDVLLTNDFYAVRTVGAYGLYTVAPAWPDPLLPDEAQRRRDLLTMYRASTDPAARAALFARYRVRWVLEVPGRWAPVAGRTPVATGPGGEHLYAV
jgi:alpha-1,6-mannosyltransferase